MVVAVAAVLALVVVVEHHDSPTVVEKVELAARMKDLVVFEHLRGSYCVVVVAVVAVAVAVEHHYNLVMADLAVDHHLHYDHGVARLDLLVLHLLDGSMVELVLIVKHEVVAIFERYFALNRLIALSIPDYDARLGGMTYTHLLCLNSEIPGWSESDRNSHRGFFEYVPD